MTLVADPTKAGRDPRLDQDADVERLAYLLEQLDCTDDPHDRMQLLAECHQLMNG